MVSINLIYSQNYRMHTIASSRCGSALHRRYISDRDISTSMDTCHRQVLKRRYRFLSGARRNEKTRRGAAAGEKGERGARLVFCERNEGAKRTRSIARAKQPWRARKHALKSKSDRSD